MLDITFKYKGKKDLSKYKLSSVNVIGKGRNQVNGDPDRDVKLVLGVANIKFDQNQNNDIACLTQPPIMVQQSINPTIDFFLNHALLARSANFAKDIQICDFLAFPGYPPWHDAVNMRPILRTGTISSDPRYDYQYKQEVLGDCL